MALPRFRWVWRIQLLVGQILPSDSSGRRKHKFGGQIDLSGTEHMKEKGNINIQKAQFEYQTLD